MKSEHVSAWKIVFTGGGTAGHVLPHFALASFPQSNLAEAIESGECEVHYIGSKNGMERDIVKAQAPRWKYHSIPTGKLRRYFSVQNFLDIFRIFAGVFVGVWIVFRLKPKVIFSKGGFVSAPVVWAGWFNRVPVVIHESDATPALATRLSYAFAAKIVLSFEKTTDGIPKKYRHKCVTLGVPLRAELFLHKEELKTSNLLKIPNNKPVLLVFGGSLGAAVLNQVVRENLDALLEVFSVLHITGKGKSFPFSEQQNQAGYRQFEFLSAQMSSVYALCDVALCRAGASSIFELLAARIPMLLVPLGLSQSRGDQIVNAKLFEGKGWAQILTEENMTGESLKLSLQKLLLEKQQILSQMEKAPSWNAALQIGNEILACKKN